MRTTNIKPINSRQQGVAMILVTVGLLVIIAMAGMALDLGHAYINNTILQNALDSSALSGAKTLDTFGDTVQAEADALLTFNHHLEGELADAGIVPVIEFSATMNPFQAGASDADARFVRTRVLDFPMNVHLARVLPGVGDTFSVSGSAVAGPSPPIGGPGAETCDIAPFLICDKSTPSGTTDNDCSDGSCFGYNVGDELCLKSPSPAGQDNGPGSNPQNAPGCSSFDNVSTGNFQLVELSCGSGGSCVREQLAGAFAGCVTEGENTNINTEPGNKVGPVAQGLNTRFGIYQGGGLSRDEAPPDLITAQDITYSEYQHRLRDEIFDEPSDGIALRRVVAAPVGECDGASSGSSTLPVSGLACVFLTQSAVQAGNEQGVYGELVERCQASGQISENPPDTNNQNSRVKFFLYKDSDSRDS